jgi:hypothetical protein
VQARLTTFGIKTTIVAKNICYEQGGRHYGVDGPRIVTTEDAPFWQVQSPFAKEGAGGE